MKNTQRYLVIIAAILLLASCASGPQISLLKPLPPGEVKLTDIQMPEYVLEDLPYDVILSIDSEETPQIRRVCFRWLTNEISSYSPSLSLTGLCPASAVRIFCPCASVVDTPVNAFFFSMPAFCRFYFHFWLPLLLPLLVAVLHGQIPG